MFRTASQGEKNSAEKKSDKPKEISLQKQDALNNTLEGSEDGLLVFDSSEFESLFVTSQNNSAEISSLKELYNQLNQKIQLLETSNKTLKDELKAQQEKMTEKKSEEEIRIKENIEQQNQLIKKLELQADAIKQKEFLNQKDALIVQLEQSLENTKKTLNDKIQDHQKLEEKSDKSIQFLNNLLLQSTNNNLQYIKHLASESEKFALEREQHASTKIKLEEKTQEILEWDKFFDDELAKWNKAFDQQTEKEEQLIVEIEEKAKEIEIHKKNMSNMLEESGYTEYLLKKTLVRLTPAQEKTKNKAENKTISTSAVPKASSTAILKKLQGEFSGACYLYSQQNSLYVDYPTQQDDAKRALFNNPYLDYPKLTYDLLKENGLTIGNGIVRSFDVSSDEESPREDSIGRPVSPCLSEAYPGDDLADDLGTTVELEEVETPKMRR